MDSATPVAIGRTIGKDYSFRMASSLGLLIPLCFATIGCGSKEEYTEMISWCSEDAQVWTPLARYCSLSTLYESRIDSDSETTALAGRPFSIA